MSGEKETGTAEPALKVGGLYKVTNPTSEHFGKVGALRSVVSYAEGLDIPTPKRPLWIEFIVWSGLHHCHTQCDFARDEVESYESEDTTPQDEIEQLREDLAEHATHLDLLQQNADSQRTNWAADRMRLTQEVKELRENAAADRLLIRNNAEQVKAAAENTGAVLADIMGRLETLEVKDIQRSADPATANKATGSAARDELTLR